MHGEQLLVSGKPERAVKIPFQKMHHSFTIEQTASDNRIPQFRFQVFCVSLTSDSATVRLLVKQNI